QHFDPFRTGAGMAGTVHHEICAKSADDVAHARDPLLRILGLLDVHRRFGTECSRELEPRLLRSADADHPSGAHSLGSGDGENANWSRALDYDGIAPGESAGAHRAVERTDAGGQRLRQ